MAKSSMVEPQGRVTLTPLGLSQAIKRERGEAAKPMPKRAIAAMLRKRKREEAVLAPQRPVLERAGFNGYLRSGSF